LESYLTETYSVQGEYPWAKYPGNQVFRHTGCRKWFALLMDIPKEKLGLPGDGEISVVNLKCDTLSLGSFREEPGIFPGYHMNKTHWLSMALAGTVEGEMVRFLVDIRYELTKSEEAALPHFFDSPVKHRSS